MTNQLIRYGKYVGIILLAILLFGSGWFVRDMGAQSEINSLIKDREIVLQEISVERNKEVGNLTAALRKSEADREVLLDQLASMKSKPAEIRYITKVETVLVGDTTTTTELPQSHEFKFENGLQVAQFDVDPGPEYSFTTADIKITANVVTGERDTSVSLQAESSLQPGEQYELAIDTTNVVEIREQKLVEPHILLSAQAGATNVGRPTGGVSIGTSIFHQGPVDFLHVRAGLGSSNALTAGLDPVLYNLGDKLPVITNLWIGPGVQLDTTGQWGVTLTAGAKL